MGINMEVAFTLIIFSLYFKNSFLFILEKDLKILNIILRPIYYSD